MRVPGNAWSVPFSKAHPRVRLQLMNRVDAGPTSSASDWWIRGGSPGQWTEEIRRFPDVLKVAPTSSIGGGTVYRLEQVDQPEVQLYRKLRLELPMPIWIQNGGLYWEAAATHADLEQMELGAKMYNPPARYRSLRRSALRSRVPTLTAAERRLFDRARAEGYYAIPPGDVSLTTLARRLRREAGPLARALARIDAKILKGSLVHSESVRRTAGFKDAAGRRVSSLTRFSQYRSRIEPK